MSSGYKKQKFLNRLADENGVAIVVVDENSQTVTAANNNSICNVLSSSAEFSASCQQFCGKAFEMTANGETVDYECFAGMQCKALPVADKGRPFTAIVGRIFVKSENYRKATEKAINGEWSNFRPTEFFENILIGGSEKNLHKVAEKLERFKRGAIESDVPKSENAVQDDILDLSIKALDITQPSAEEQPPSLSALIERFHIKATESAAYRAPDVPREKGERILIQSDSPEIQSWRSLFGKLLELDYKEACKSILLFLQNRFGLNSLVWLERTDQHFESLVTTGYFSNVKIRIKLASDNKKMLAAVKNDRPLEFSETGNTAQANRPHMLSLYPVVIGGEVRGAIGVQDRLNEPETERKIAQFAKTVASPLEILRLRNEVSVSNSLSRSVARFNESLRNIDADDFWTHIAQISAEHLHAERASILISDESTKDLRAKASIGLKIDLSEEPEIGQRVARHVLSRGVPIVVADLENAGMSRSPNDWAYKTNSFISYPIIIGKRKIGIMNFTDKADGKSFTESDLDLLKAIAPQIAVAIDRTTLKEKAGQYEQLSVTDTLTQLLNRRYIEERLAEEIIRSQRHRFPMSLLMLDVDNFKSYNDNFGHPAGDIALKLLADVLKETLRGADVAARYGGEEFAILLPQTSREEARQIAERIRLRIERTKFPMRKVTVSIGIASFSNEVDSPKDLISAADIALYDAKNGGRNSVKVFTDLGDSVVENIH